MPDTAFFTCQHHFPENLWRPDYQRHANGATGIDSVFFVGRDPADYHIFLTGFTGQHDIGSDSLGIEFELGNGKVEVLTPVAIRGFFGAEIEADPKPRLVGLRVAVSDLDHTRALLAKNGVPFTERLGALVVAPAEACGAVLVFLGG